MLNNLDEESKVLEVQVYKDCIKTLLMKDNKTIKLVQQGKSLFRKRRVQLRFNEFLHQPLIYIK